MNLFQLAEALREWNLLSQLDHARIERVDPPEATYFGGRPPSRTSGKCSSASSSQIVTWARMSFTDQSPTTPPVQGWGGVLPLTRYGSAAVVKSSAAGFRAG